METKAALLFSGATGTVGAVGGLKVSNATHAFPKTSISIVWPAAVSPVSSLPFGKTEIYKHGVLLDDS